jgi:hypothetical protein
MVEDMDRLDRVEITIQPVDCATYTCSDSYPKSRVSDRIDIIERKRSASFGSHVSQLDTTSGRLHFSWCDPSDQRKR